MKSNRFQDLNFFLTPVCMLHYFLSRRTSVGVGSLAFDSPGEKSPAQLSVASSCLGNYLPFLEEKAAILRIGFWFS